MTITLSPAQVQDICDETVTATMIDFAANVIEEYTGYTPNNHVVQRTIPAVDVRVAWAVVAVRVSREAKGAGDEAVTSETVEGYAISEDPKLAARYRGNYMEGLPLRALSIAEVATFHLRPGQTITR